MKRTPHRCSKPTLSSRRNYWKSQTEEAKYAREIRGLLRDYAAALKAAVDQCTTTDMNGNPVIDMPAFIRKRDEIADTLKPRLETLASMHAKTSLTKGIQYAEGTMQEINDAS